MQYLAENPRWCLRVSIFRIIACPPYAFVIVRFGYATSRTRSTPASPICPLDTLVLGVGHCQSVQINTSQIDGESGPKKRDTLAQLLACGSLSAPAHVGTVACTTSNPRMSQIHSTTYAIKPTKQLYFATSPKTPQFIRDHAGALGHRRSFAGAPPALQGVHYELDTAACAWHLSAHGDGATKVRIPNRCTVLNNAVFEFKGVAAFAVAAAQKGSGAAPKLGPAFGPSAQAAPEGEPFVLLRERSWVTTCACPCAIDLVENSIWQAVFFGIPRGQCLIMRYTEMPMGHYL